MLHRWTSLLSRSGQLLMAATNIPEPRFNKLMVEVKEKLKENTRNPDKFEDAFSKYVDFKYNYLMLAYPKIEFTDKESKSLF